jgi:hypothetical protein
MGQYCKTGVEVNCFDKEYCKRGVQVGYCDKEGLFHDLMYQHKKLLIIMRGTEPFSASL